jgi:hypothetical protein
LTFSKNFFSLLHYLYFFKHTLYFWVKFNSTYGLSSHSPPSTCLWDFKSNLAIEKSFCNYHIFNRYKMKLRALKICMFDIKTEITFFNLPITSIIPIFVFIHTVIFKTIRVCAQTILKLFLRNWV